MNRLWMTGTVALSLLLGGCFGGKEHSQPLTSQQFFSPTVEQTSVSPVDQSSPIEYNQVNMDLMDSPEELRRQLLRQDMDRPPPQASVRQVSPIVKESVKPRTPATLPVAIAPGGYMTIGGVVAEVNGKPIYADQILRDLEPDLASKARDLDETQFRAVAEQEIAQEVQRAIYDELVFAAAERGLDERERDMADALTEKWRGDRITEAGGSLEVTRRKAAEQGQDFEAMVKEQYRVHMTQIYYQKKVYPRIQVTADDMRRYYERNRAKEFTEHGQAQFRLIKVEVKKIGSRDEAIQRTKEIRQRVTTGKEDFAQVASAMNHDETLRKSAGDVGFIDKGSFRLEEIEKAVWTLKPGDVSDVIDLGDAFYVVKLEQLKEGRQRQFEEPNVQAAIRNKLWSEQFQALRDAEREHLLKQALVQSNGDMLQIALEMAMQKYPRWASIQ